MKLVPGLPRIGSVGTILLLMLSTGLAGCTSEPPPTSWPEAYSLVPYLPSRNVLLPESEMRFKSMTYFLGVEENPGFLSLNRSKWRPHLIEVYAAVGGTPDGEDILLSIAYRWDSPANATANIPENYDLECRDEARSLNIVLHDGPYVVRLVAVAEGPLTQAQRDDLHAVAASIRENTGAVAACLPRAST